MQWGRGHESGKMKSGGGYFSGKTKPGGGHYSGKMKFQVNFIKKVNFLAALRQHQMSTN